MLECLILGDSIAVGTKMFKPECHAFAKGGINSRQYNRQYPQRFSSDIVVISLGSNDHKGVRTRKELEDLRNRVDAKSEVYWILPAGNLRASEVPIENIQAIVRDIAEKRGDVVLPIPDLQKDSIHPNRLGYKKIVEQIK